MKVKNIEHLDINKLCTNRGIYMTKQRRVIANVINKSKDHPDAEKIYFRSNKENKNISLATVYRTVKLFEDANIIIRHDFKHGDEKARYESISKWDFLCSVCNTQSSNSHFTEAIPRRCAKGT